MRCKNRLSSLCFLFLAIVFVSSSASALDLNSSNSLQYYGNGNLGLEATTGGDVSFPGIADFSSSGITFEQPLSVQSSGPFSVGSGIDLTDSSSNTIESYSTFYLTTSSGSASDIVLEPTGEVGVGSNLNMGGNPITDTSGALTLDSNVETTGNLNMNGNSITSYFGSACSSGNVVADIGDDGSLGCVSAANEVQDTYVNRNGDTMTGTLDMQGNNVISIGNLGGSGIVNTNNIASGAVTPTELDETASYSLGWGNLAIAQSDITVADLGAADSNLNMNGYSITNFFGGACNSGNVVNHINDDGSIDCIDATNEVQSDFVNRNGDTMTGTLDMQNNNLFLGDSVYLTENSNNDMILQGRDPQQKLELTDGGSLVYREYTSPANNVFEVDSTGSGNAAVRLGEAGSTVNLDMNGNSITNYFGSSCPSGEVVADVNDNGNFGCVNIDSEIQNTYVNRNGDTMTGNLDMQGNNVNSVGTLQIDNMSLTGGYGTGGIDLNNERLFGLDSFTFNDAGPDGHIDWGTGAEIYAAPLDDSNSDGYLQFVNDGGIAFEPSTDGTTAASFNTNNNFNMRGNSIINFFGGACSSGNVINHVNDDGSLDCIDATNEVQSDFVNRAGDTMTGSLGMGSNSINNVGSGNIDIGDGAGDINMNGNRIYGSSLGHFNEGGISGTLSNTQNNLDTLSANSFYVAGDVKVGGDFVGTGGDVAENVRTYGDQKLEAGTVTTISGEVEVDASTEARDTAVAGVVSTDPGVRLAEERDGVPLALTGIVPVKTTVENGDIEPGDLLTTSDREGYAMKCKDSLECHGAILGKAMGSLDETGKVEVLVTLG